MVRPEDLDGNDLRPLQVEPNASWRRGLGYLPWLFALAFALAVLRIGPHPDDLRIASDVEPLTYAELWSSPFLDRFYRPLTVTLVKASRDVFGDSWIPLRLLQAFATLGAVRTLAALAPSRSPMAWAVAGLALLCARTTFAAVGPFAVGFSDTIVVLCLFAAVKEMHEPRLPVLVALSLVAVASKESGVLVMGYVALALAQRRAWAGAGTFCALAAGFVALRASVVPSRSFLFGAGYFFEFLSPAELSQRFGERPLFLYVYNVVGNLAQALTAFPERGVLVAKPSLLLALPAALLSTVVALRRALRAGRAWGQWPLAAVIPMNAVLGYGYVRGRTMFTAGAVVAALLLIGLDDENERTRRGLLLAWLLAGIAAVVRIYRQGG